MRHTVPWANNANIIEASLPGWSRELCSRPRCCASLLLMSPFRTHRGTNGSRGSHPSLWRRAALRGVEALALSWPFHYPKTMGAVNGRDDALQILDERAPGAFHAAFIVNTYTRGERGAGMVPAP
ncbi:hypothetical protein HPB50_024256 [Hyalomma asiaticum]|uniref:Uncharacterized protein n=1 Tax=Hyalomma asiaticum TaxID=266040 RepID=A0ACB7SBU7_HYAAI|nr:hypothetical protein HPB50_024256 [Hyalomma asiaticum]